MVRGFVDMGNASAANRTADGALVRLQTGAAIRMDSVLAMRMAWRALADRSELPTTQFEWAVAAMNQVGPRIQAHVGYVTDGGTMRAILPLLVKRRLGIDHLHFMSPGITMPIEIVHTDRPSLEQLLRATIRIGRPIVLQNLVEESGATELLKEMASERRAIIKIEKAEPVTYLPIANYQLQDKFQSAARVSILATSYGLSGGPNDVIFQCVSPSMEQVMQLYHESMQLQAASSSESAAAPRRQAPRDLDTFEFLRTYAFQCAQRGEVRFSCLRIGERLLAVQMFLVRKQTAWLLTAAHLDRFRGTTLDTLLMTETIRKMQVERIQTVVAPSGAGVREVGQCREMSCVNIRIYPWSTRSLMAMMVGGGRRQKAAEPEQHDSIA